MPDMPGTAANVTIRPATLTDAAAITQAHYEALEAYHDFYGTFFKKHPGEFMPGLTEKALKKTPEEGRGGNVFFVAEEVQEVEGAEKRDVVGFVRYEVKSGKGQEKDGEGDEGKEGKTDKEESPYACKEVLQSVWGEFCDAQAARDAMVEKCANGQQHIWIQHLMIRPSHQRRGIGKALLGHVLQKADDVNLDAIIVSSAESFGLYKKMGFTSMGRYIIDNGHWAREVARVRPGPESDELVERYDGVFEVEDVMIRPAGKSETKSA